MSFKSRALTGLGAAIILPVFAITLIGILVVVTSSGFALGTYITGNDEWGGAIGMFFALGVAAGLVLACAPEASPPKKRRRKRVLVTNQSDNSLDGVYNLNEKTRPARSRRRRIK